MFTTKEPMGTHCMNSLLVERSKFYRLAEMLNLLDHFLFLKATELIKIVGIQFV